MAGGGEGRKEASKEVGREVGGKGRREKGKGKERRNEGSGSQRAAPARRQVRNFPTTGRMMWSAYGRFAWQKSTQVIDSVFTVGIQIIRLRKL